uniref:Delta(14)-sterol reductase n=1 Tax=Timema cristinae TaxID=61476 RepID=A0A7R9H1N2_TIMCR|nr:unnamed protein product [Timema cristinae]
MSSLEGMGEEGGRESMLIGERTTSCSFVDNKLNIPLNWQAYFDPMAAAIYLGFVAFLLLLYFLPVGEHIEAADSRAVSYRCNGFLTALVALAVVGGLHYQDYPVTVVYDKYIQLIVSSLVLGFVLAIILFIKGGRVPINATLGKNHIYLFWMGREVTPHFGPVAIKVLIFRIGVIGSVVLTSALVVKHFGPNPSQYSPTLAVSVAMQIIYLLDSLWFEKVWATSFEFKYEGVGAMLAAGYCVYPFLNTLVVKYIVEHRYVYESDSDITSVDDNVPDLRNPAVHNMSDSDENGMDDEDYREILSPEQLLPSPKSYVVQNQNKVELPPYYLAVLATVFIIGLVIFRLSNNLKDEFRTNPLSRKLEGNDADQARVRLSAGCALLKICEVPALWTCFSTALLSKLASIITDKVKQVRLGFARRLTRGLCREPGLPNDLLAFFPLSELSPDRQVCQQMREMLRKAIAAKRLRYRRLVLIEQGVETISSFGGKKLLVSSWWGWLRHPNYLGDILIHWAWGLTCGWPIVLPYFLALATTMLLVHRAVRDDIRCKQRYGTAWDRYCSRVKYRIVPHVF